MRVRLTRRGRIPRLCEPCLCEPWLSEPPADYGEPRNPGENPRAKTGVSRVPLASPGPAR
jgi:hypothetical protein